MRNLLIIYTGFFVDGTTVQYTDVYIELKYNCVLTEITVQFTFLYIKDYSTIVFLFTGINRSVDDNSVWYSLCL